MGVDLARVRVHHDRRDALGAVGDPGVEDRLLDGELEPGVDRQPDVRSGHAGLVDDGGLRDRAGVDVALSEQDARRAGEQLLVALLDAVLADALAVDEADEVRRERRIRAAARLRVGPQRLRLERHVRERPAADRRGNPLRDVRRDVARKDDVLATGPDAVVERLAAGGVELQDPGELVDEVAALVRLDLVRRDHDAVAFDARGEHDRPAPVVDRAAGARLLGPERRLTARLGREGVAAHDLPPREAADDRDRRDDKGDEENQQSGA
jgi:hypothetical protein